MHTSKLTFLSVNVSRRIINKSIIIIFFLNLFFITGTWLSNITLLNYLPNELRKLVLQLNLTAENNAAAWYSSMLLLMVAVMAFACFLVDYKSSRLKTDHYLNWGWLVLVSIFSLLSFDEMGSFHEMIGETALFKNLGHGEVGGWYVFYGLIALVAFFMLFFALAKFRKSAWAFLLSTIGLILLASNPFQENFEINSYRNAPDPSHWVRPVMYALLEEGSEIFASMCFFCSFCIYAIYSSSKNTGETKQSGFQMKLMFSNNFLVYLMISLVGFGGAMLLVRADAWHLAGDDVGIPHNWFPSFLFLLAALVSLILSNMALIQSSRLYKFLAFHCTMASMFFGANLSGFRHFSKLYSVGILAWAIALGVFGFYKKVQGSAKWAFIAWTILLACLVFTNGFVLATIGYLAAGAVLMGLVFILTGLTAVKPAIETSAKQHKVD